MATAWPADSIICAYGTPAASARCSKWRISSTVTIFMGICYNESDGGFKVGGDCIRAMGKVWDEWAKARRAVTSAGLGGGGISLETGRTGRTGTRQENA